MPARLSVADSLRLVEQLARRARNGHAHEAAETLTRLGEAARPETIKVIDSIVTSHEGSTADRIEAVKDELARALRYTHTFDWSEIGGGVPPSSTTQISEVRKSSVSPAVFMEGKVVKDEEGYLLFKSGGKSYFLSEADPERIIPYPNGRSIDMSWVSGLVDEDHVVLKGAISGENDSTFKMEGFAKKMPGRHDWETFTPARVASRVGGDWEATNLFSSHNIPGDVQAVLSTADGIAYIKDPELAKQLAQLPRLAFMLPGELKRAHDGTLTYEGKPRDLQIFVRIMDTPEGGQFNGDTAWSHFSSRPVTVTKEYMDRAKEVHSNDGSTCIWAQGNFKFDPTNGEATGFAADWLSKDAETGDGYLR